MRARLVLPLSPSLPLPLALSLLLASCSGSPPPPPDEAPPAPSLLDEASRIESCEAELHHCGPTWIGCVHVRSAGRTPDDLARFEGDDGAFYVESRTCGADGQCTDHCPGGVCRPGVARVPEGAGATLCSFLSPPPAPASFTCALEAGRCVRAELAPR